MESLLAVDTHAKSVLETPAVLLADTTVPRLLEGQRIGPYEIASRNGAGSRTCSAAARRATASSTGSTRLMRMVT